MEQKETKPGQDKPAEVSIAKMSVMILAALVGTGLGVWSTYPQSIFVGGFFGFLIGILCGGMLWRAIEAK